MKKTLRVFVLAVLAVLGSGPVFADSEPQLDHADVDIGNTAGLRSGARTFVDYCVNCHSASLMRYKRLTDVGFSEQQIRDELVFVGDKKVSRMMDVSMTRSDAKLWFGAAPPDLSVIARSRSADWLYSYLRAFYRDPLTPSGWNNLVFEHAAMPHALWQLQGNSVLDVQRFRTRKEAEAARARIMSYSVIEETTEDIGGRETTLYALKSIRTETPGTLSQPQYDQTVRDLVGFLVWMGEPNQILRKKAGIPVLVFCFIFVWLTWLLYREFWKDLREDVGEHAAAGARARVATGIPQTEPLQPANECPAIPYDSRVETA